MTPFNQWSESLILAGIFSFIIIVPCIFVAIIGKKMIDRMGRHPSKSPIIQMSVFWPFIVIEIITFCLLIAFFQFFSGKTG